MNAKFLITSAVVIGLLLLTAWLPVAVTQAEEQPTELMAQSASTSLSAGTGVGLSETASGSVEDTLKMCLSRIPEDASAGQRLIAVESCNRDKAERQSIDAVPGA